MRAPGIGEQAEKFDKQPATPRSSRLALLFALVALGAVAAGLAVGYQYWTSMKQSLEQLNRTLAMANQDQVAMGERLAQTSLSIQQQQQKIAEQDRQLREQHQQWEQERDALRHQEDLDQSYPVPDAATYRWQGQLLAGGGGRVSDALGKSTSDLDG